MIEDARSIGNFLLETAWMQGQKITHLQLQKILFFTHAWHLAKYDSPLIGQSFEAWQYGPVVRVVYDQLKNYKKEPITKKLQKIDIDSGAYCDAAPNLSEDKKRFILSIFDYYSKFHAMKLVDLTHIEGGPWESVWNKAVDNAVPGMLISNEEIKLWILREGGRGGTLTN